ncbi:MAG: hypothetical protein ACI8RD_001677 [Bacillariaceae sp.]|jgi:hypothetical protein
MRSIGIITLIRYNQGEIAFLLLVQWKILLLHTLKRIVATVKSSIVILRVFVYNHYHHRHR